MADIRAKSFNFGGSDRYIIPQEFIINVTGGNPFSADIQDITVDKTYAEILEAYNMGHTLYVVYNSVRLSLTGFSVSDGLFGFGANMLHGVTSVQLFEDGTNKGKTTFFELVPPISASDAGKVLMVGDNGKAAWTTIINAEEVAY